MVRKIIRNATLAVAGVGIIVSLNVTTTPQLQAADTYKDTAVAGIDAAIDQYVMSLGTVEADTEAVESTEAVQTDILEQAAAPESTARYPQFENKLMANVTDYMNIRAEADENSDAVGKLPQGAVAEVLEQGDTWTKIESGSVTGYVKNEYVLFGDDAGDYAEANCDKIATVTTTT